MKPERLALVIALIAAWVATLGSLWFSEVQYFVPCRYCWFQRIIMYPMALLIPMGLLLRDRHLPRYTLAYSLLGAPLALYHYLLQTTNLFSDSTACAAGGVACSTIDWQIFGFVTIPFLSLIGFSIILICSLVALNVKRPLWDESERLQDRAVWLPVVVVVGLGLLWFSGSYATRPAAPEPIPTLPALGNLPDAQPIFAANCMGCHGTQGQGTANSAPALDDTQLLRDPDLFATVVREGRPADHPDNVSGLPMPAFGTLSPDEIEALRFYIQALSRER